MSSRSPLPTLFCTSVDESELDLCKLISVLISTIRVSSNSIRVVWSQRCPTSSLPADNRASGLLAPDSTRYLSLLSPQTMYVSTQRAYVHLTNDPFDSSHQLPNRGEREMERRTSKLSLPVSKGKQPRYNRKAVRSRESTPD